GAVRDVRETNAAIAEEQAVAPVGLQRDVAAAAVAGGVTIGGRLTHRHAEVAYHRVDAGAPIGRADEDGEHRSAQCIVARVPARYLQVDEPEEVVLFDIGQQQRRPAPTGIGVGRVGGRVRARFGSVEYRSPEIAGREG